MLIIPAVDLREATNDELDAHFSQASTMLKHRKADFQRLTLDRAAKLRATEKMLAARGWYLAVATEMNMREECERRGINRWTLNATNEAMLRHLVQEGL